MAVISLGESKEIAERIVLLEPRFHEVVARFGPCPIGTTRSRESNFAALVQSILGQQLSIKAAETIIERVKRLSKGKLDPQILGKIPPQRLRKAGCSQHKTRAVRELAVAITSGRLNLKSIGKKSEVEISELLLPLHGIGNWTIEMFMIFQLGRIDVWPVGDLGVRRGWEKIHQVKGEITPLELKEAGEKFRPFRSHLAWYCWRAHSIYK